MKTPFDIKFRPQIESGEYKVETREGKPVRIICWDRKPLSFPISALVVIGKDSEESHCYSAQGIDKFYQVYRGCDLIITTPEPELTEFEQALETFLMNADASEQTFHEDVKKYATELLELAKKEALEEHLAQSINEREIGKAEALANMPRWKRADEELYLKDMCVVVDGNLVIAKTEGEIPKGALYLYVSDLLKLPGFNE